MYFDLHPRKWDCEIFNAILIVNVKCLGSSETDSLTGSATKYLQLHETV